MRRYEREISAAMTLPRTALEAGKQQAIRLYGDGDLAAALQVCKTICEAGASDAVVYCLMGAIHGQLNDFVKSVEFSRRAIDLCPEYVEAHYNLALAARQLGAIEQSIESLQFVVSRKPRDADVRHSLGFALEWAGDYERALAEYRMARSLRADHLDACAGEASIHEKRGDFDAAWRILQPYVEGGVLGQRRDIPCVRAAGAVARRRRARLEPHRAFHGNHGACR